MIHIYGITIENESSFWDEVKLRAMNNYGEWETENIALAIDDVLENIKETLTNSADAKRLEKEIVEKQS